MIVPPTADPARGIELDLSPSELLARIGRGDAEALGWFYDRWEGPVHALVARLIRGPDAQERVMEAVFRAVWERAGSYALAPVERWVHALAITCCRAELRARLATLSGTAEPGAGAGGLVTIIDRASASAPEMGGVSIAE